MVEQIINSIHTSFYDRQLKNADDKNTKIIRTQKIFAQYQNFWLNVLTLGLYHFLVQRFIRRAIKEEISKKKIELLPLVQFTIQTLNQKGLSTNEKISHLREELFRSEPMTCLFKNNEIALLLLMQQTPLSSSWKQHKNLIREGLYEIEGKNLLPLLSYPPTDLSPAARTLETKPYLYATLPSRLQKLFSPPKISAPPVESDPEVFYTIPL